MKQRILFVDDEPRVLDSLRRMLRQQHNWDMRFIADSQLAWDYLQEKTVDAMVTDLKMPGINGLELLERMQQVERLQEVPVIVLTGLGDQRLKREALRLGATDLLTKPVEAADLLARLQSVLRLKACQDDLKASNRRLEEQVAQRTNELHQSRLGLIWRLGKIAEQRDDQRGNHVIRVGFISRIVAEALGMNRQFQENIFLTSPLHDIGKLVIPDRILFKRRPLGPGETSVMRQHCTIGARLLSEDAAIQSAFFHWRAIDSGLAIEGDPNPFVRLAASIALNHHEWWDGNGYPNGIAGELIPLDSRIVAVADVYDALTSRRSYRAAYPEDRALTMIREGVGTQFDPDVHKAFLRALPEIRALRTRFDDETHRTGDAEEACDEASLVC